jgi:hypothetical protein
MSLTKVNTLDIVKRQYRYKLKAYSQVLVSLMILQSLAIIFSLSGTGMMGSSGGMVDMEVHYFSADIVVGFTMLWGFITAILTTTKAYRNDDFVFITNRISSHLSNTLFLFTASVVGGLTSMLSSYALKGILYFLMKGIFVEGPQAGPSPSLFLLGILTTSLYIFLFAGFGYLVGTLVQINKIFVVLLPALLLGSVFFAGASGKTGIMESIFQIYFTESSLFLFTVKVLITVVTLFAGAFILSNQMEVKQK